ncbi:hypothetical protein NLJ89_g2343 [Agrocybe chaxingu]|uniref:Uncharacterized protein n=1 Tax=Agrocybe chaxingu TaxID=84603 RepID=A0A9W8K7J6_9AGAR|nr:hypothetical protein NLJ89_g2343 [Agrocybe chaxingu]
MLLVLASDSAPASDVDSQPKNDAWDVGDDKDALGGVEIHPADERRGWVCRGHGARSSTSTAEMKKHVHLPAKNTHSRETPTEALPVLPRTKTTRPSNFFLAPLQHPTLRASPHPPAVQEQADAALMSTTHADVEHEGSAPRQVQEVVGFVGGILSSSIEWRRRGRVSGWAPAMAIRALISSCQSSAGDDQRECTYLYTPPSSSIPPFSVPPRHGKHPFPCIRPECPNNPPAFEDRTDVPARSRLTSRGSEGVDWRADAERKTWSFASGSGDGGPARGGVRLRSPRDPPREYDPPATSRRRWVSPFHAVLAFPDVIWMLQEVGGDRESGGKTESSSASAPSPPFLTCYWKTRSSESYMDGATTPRAPFWTISQKVGANRLKSGFGDVPMIRTVSDVLLFVKDVVGTEVEGVRRRDGVTRGEGIDIASSLAVKLQGHLMWPVGLFNGILRKLSRVEDEALKVYKKAPRRLWC